MLSRRAPPPLLERAINDIMWAMFSFLKKSKPAQGAGSGPVVYTRPEHCISRKNIDHDALRVLYRLANLGYTAYLVGGGVRDLLLGRKPKDFDVGTSALPNEVKRAFHNCFLIGRRFRLAHIKFGPKIIETATFRRESRTVGEIIEHAADGPQEDNTFGTPETDAFRRDFTINGLFYNIRDFSVIDWVGGMKDLQAKVIRAIGDPDIRFQEDPVRMMRAIKFASRLGFTIEPKTAAAMKRHHACILNASVPRVCEEVFRLFTYGHSSEAFRMMWEYRMLHDLVPEVSDAITKTGGENSPLWRYLDVLDEYDSMRRTSGGEPSNALRAAVLSTVMLKLRDGGMTSRKAVAPVLQHLHISKGIYFSSVLILESVRRLSQPPSRGKSRFVKSKDFADALDYNRIIARAEGRDERALDEWAVLYEREEAAARRRAAEAAKEADQAEAKAIRKAAEDAEAADREARGEE